MLGKTERGYGKEIRKKLERKVDEVLCYCTDSIGDGRGRLKGAEIFIARGYPDDVIYAIKSHVD